MSDQTPQSNSQERHCMTLEEEIYQESLEVLSQMDDEEASVRETLQTPPASPLVFTGSHKRVLFPEDPPPIFMTPTTIELSDDFYRDNQATVNHIYSVVSNQDDADEDYCVPLEHLPEYKAYICVRKVRKKRRYWIHLPLVILCCLMVLMKLILTTTGGSSNEIDVIRKELADGKIISKTLVPSQSVDSNSIKIETVTAMPTTVTTTRITPYPNVTISSPKVVITNAANISNP